MKKISLKKEFPTEPHYAVVVYERVSVPGWNPGDPSEFEDIARYISFDSKDDLEDWIDAENSSYSKKDFSVIKATPLTVSVTVKVED